MTREARHIVALTVLAASIQLPFLDEGISLLDEGSILTISSELAAGDVLYRDQITFVAPLINELLSALFRIFGEWLVVARLLQASLFVATVLLGYAVLRPALGSGWAFGSAVAVIALKPLGFPLYTIVNYSQLGMALILGALAAGLRFTETGRTRWLLTAGFLCGFCLLAKQNLGVISVCVVSTALLRDAWPGSSFRALAAQGLILLGAAAVPLVVAGGLYASAGALGEVARLVLIRALEAHEDWIIPVPPLWPWGGGPEAGALLYAYLPGTLADLQFQGLLKVGSFPALLLEWAVKLAYVVPLAAIVGLGVRTFRGRSQATRREVLDASLLVGAVLAFMSMLYRADWAHLSNIAPLLILATAAAASPRRALGVSALTGWLALGFVAAGAMGISQRQTVDTPRGKIAGLVHKADQLERVLRWSESVDPERSVAFLPAQPLLHFLSGRSLPLSVDLIVSWTVKEPEDRRLAEELANVDLVVFDPHGVPWVGGELLDFAPRFAEVMARRFEPVEVVSPAAIVLERRESDPPWAMVVDLWSRSPQDQREVWLAYRTIAPPISEAAPRSCVRHALRPQRRHELVARPLFDPKTWARDYRGIWFPDPAAARFEILVDSEDGSSSVEYRETLEAGVPPRAVSVPLGRWAGETVELALCVELEPGSSGFAPVGWAEAAVVEAAETR